MRPALHVLRYDGAVQPGSRGRSRSSHPPAWRPSDVAGSVFTACQPDAGRSFREGATVAFEIPPTFFQSRVFLALCILLALVPLWLLYRLRVAQVARGMAHDFNLRLDERVNERTRIARELHDTLLQSFQGSMLHFQSARNLLPAQPEKAVEALDGALDRADQAVVEGRDAIQNLRSSTIASNELAQTITTLAEELTNGPGS